MKCIHILLFSFLTGSVLLVQTGCHEPARSQQPAEAAGRPKIAFETAVYDFGEVGPGTKHAGRFQFTNEGDSTLEITEVKKCCGVSAKLAQGKTEYPPGESGIIEVQYNATSRPTSIRRHLYVTSNDTANPKVELTLKARIVSKVDYQPKAVQFSLVEEQAANPTLTLTSADGKPFSIASVSSTNSCITVEVDPAVEATSFVLPLRMDADRLGGRTSGTIALMLTCPERTRLLVPFRVQQEYRALPSQLVLFNTVPGQATKRGVSILSDVHADFTIDAIESEKDFVKVTAQEKVANGYRLVVEITPPSPEDKQSIATDVLHVRMGQHDLAVSVRMMYRGTLARQRAAAGGR